MTSLSAKSPIGVFEFSENGKLLHYKLFSRDPQKALAEFESDPAKLDKKACGFLRKNIREYANSLGHFNGEEFNSFVCEFAALLSKKSMKIERDKLLIQANNALADVGRALSLCEERIGEWFGLHYPELKSSKMDIVDRIIKYGSRINFPDFRESSGTELTEDDEKAVTEFAILIRSMHEEKNRLESYIKESMDEIAPNFSSLIEPLLAAKLLSLSGSLEKLARMPASTIQLLGSEKALFRHLKKQGKSPKYGILFIDRRIQSAPKEKKGKVARIIASKLMLAARIDYYSKRLEARLKEEMEKELKNVLENPA